MRVPNQHGATTAAAAARAAGELLLPVVPEFLAALREAAPTARFLAAPAGEIWRPERVLPTVDIAAAISCVRVPWGVLSPSLDGLDFVPFMRCREKRQLANLDARSRRVLRL